MATNSKTIVVGQFEQTSANSDTVPDRMRGNKILFSESEGYFIIQGKNGDEWEFGMDKFRQFVDGGVILYTTPGIQRHMERILTEYETRNNRTSTESLPESDYAPAYDDEPEYREEARRSVGHRGDDNYNESTGKATAVKDPTKRLGIFFAVTFIISVIVCIVLNFGQPIVQGVSGLLS